MKAPPFPDTPQATLARYIRSQVALAQVKPAGCVQLNNAEALLCAEALEALAAQHNGLCVECGARVVDNSPATRE